MMGFAELGMVTQGSTARQLLPASKCECRLFCNSLILRGPVGAGSPSTKGNALARRIFCRKVAPLLRGRSISTMGTCVLCRKA